MHFEGTLPKSQSLPLPLSTTQNIRKFFVPSPPAVAVDGPDELTDADSDPSPQVSAVTNSFAILSSLLFFTAGAFQA